MPKTHSRSSTLSSEIEFFSCSVNVNNGILIKLTEICTSVKAMELAIDSRSINFVVNWNPKPII